MPTNKDFKRLVRRRMHKTGESYTSARAHLLNGKRPTLANRVFAAQPLAPVTAPQPKDYAKLAGMSDAVVKKATGCTWERWVKALDKAEANTWSHRKIVDYVHDKYKTPSWWTQMVVVGYERIKGLRAKGQRRDGGYEATKSKIFPVPLTVLFDAWKNGRIRSRWLEDEITIRGATENKNVRINWPDGTSVVAAFYAKGAGKSQLALTHSKLKDAKDAEHRKAFWTERLSALGQVLASGA